MPSKARKSAPQTAAFFLEQQETYSIHLSLFQPHPSLKPAPFQSDIRVVLDNVFDRLPDSALQGQHGLASRSHRSFINRDRSTKSFGSPIDIRFGPIRIDWAERARGGQMSEASRSQHAGSSYASADSGTAATAAAASASSSARPQRRKHVFHAKQPQVALPVATFHKTDSFEGDASGSRDADQQNLASCNEKFQGMTIGATEVAFGIVHLFRDKQDAAASAARTTGPAGATSIHPDLQNQIPEQDLGAVVAVLAVPSHLTASHFLSYIEPAVEAITHLRMVRDMHPNRCMVLIRFRDAKDAEDFHKMYNGQPFNAMDPQEICQVVYITSLTVSKHTSLPFSYPTLTNSDPWPTNAANQSAHELPTCPVCLERMDSSVTGLMTISCQHTFHCSCLSKWGESRCPVCRYSQTGQPSAHHRRSRTPRSSMDPSTPSRNGNVGTADADANSDAESDVDEPSCCAVCETQQDLWVCLVCASVGCGRYKQGHAHRHFSETGHLYSLELETQRVWDYAGDGYVHRLIQNKADGKLVELPSASSATATPERSRTLPASASYASAMSTSGTKHSGPPTMSSREDEGRRQQYAHEHKQAPSEAHEGSAARGVGSSRSADEKLEAIGMEYSYLLTSQLESQRHFYEDKLDQFQAQLTSLTGELSTLTHKAKQIDELSTRTTELERTNELLKRDKEKSDKKAERAVELARTLERDLHSERSMNKGLMERLERTKESEEALKAQVTDLQEQVNDLMFFVQARDKLDQEGGEAQGGDVELRAKPTSAARKGKGRKK
ncbi:hypothetical protein EX895_001428 [Sporisorium graminicola]|uniref:RING-type domain-containing protein n=1 Tax=Sporisorium graminicola TaxID=280036 RepID=A0A4U7KY53_9BASI|nr:hypothetical protein EX895_001428 [Sporisorium graminicola]TKY89643.1 hypothetical protein EX895_001428 [Sporisorium graminicola]